VFIDRRAHMRICRQCAGRVTISVCDLEGDMSKTALSVYMYGLYLITGVALPFLIVPHFTLGIFGLSAADELWVRFTGLLAGVIGGFYVAAVLTRNDPVLAWTIPARYASATFMAAVVALGVAGPGLLVFAAFDALTASLTWVAIKADAAENVTA